MIVTASGPTVTAVSSAVRRHLGLKLKDSRESMRSGGEDGLWRVHLADGTIIETTITLRKPVVIY
jgi:hypothetical protein